MYSANPDRVSKWESQVLLDGQPLEIPANRRSLAAIRSYLAILAMEQQRILRSLTVDGEPANLTQPLTNHSNFTCIEAETLDLAQLPLQLIKTAIQQVACARSELNSAVVLVLINDGKLAREFWWNLAVQLKEPLLTMSLLPETAGCLHRGHASQTQLRKWQLQQLAAILREIDEACWFEDTRVLSHALESRALPWLDNLEQSLNLLLETTLAAQAAQVASAEFAP
jgi:hypothetical protein